MIQPVELFLLLSFGRCDKTLVLLPRSDLIAPTRATGATAVNSHCTPSTCFWDSNGLVRFTMIYMGLPWVYHTSIRWIYNDLHVFTIHPLKRPSLGVSDRLRSFFLVSTSGPQPFEILRYNDDFGRASTTSAIDIPMDLRFYQLDKATWRLLSK